MRTSQASACRQPCRAASDSTQQCRALSHSMLEAYAFPRISQLSVVCSDRRLAEIRGPSALRCCEEGTGKRLGSTAGYRGATGHNYGVQGTAPPAASTLDAMRGDGHHTHPVAARHGRCPSCPTLISLAPLPCSVQPTCLTPHLPYSLPPASSFPSPFPLIPSPPPPPSLPVLPFPLLAPRIIVPSLRDFAKRADDKAKNSGIRLVKIWEERRVFSPSQTKDLKEALKAAPAVKAPQGSAAKGAGEEQKKAQVGGGGGVPGGGRRGTATGWLS